MRKFLLKNLEIQTNSKLVKSNSDGTTDELITAKDVLEEATGITPETLFAYSEIAKDFITHAAITIGVTYSVCKIVGRLCR